MRKRELDALGVSAVCESLAMLLQAGIAADEAVALLQTEQKHEGVLAEGLRCMQRTVEQGGSLAAAMRGSGIFPAYCLQTAETGEQTGRLEQCLFRLSAYYASQYRIGRRLRAALVYPAAMLGLLAAVLAVLLWAVLPTFRGVYEQFTGSLDASGYRYVGLSFGFCRAALIVTAALAVLLLAGLLLWNRGGRKLVEKVLYRIPPCAALLRAMGLFRFTAALQTYLASGELQDEAVRKSLPAADCKPVEDCLRRCLRSMEQGHGFAQAAWDNALFEPVYGRMLLAGERSGSPETVLGRLCALLETEVETKVETVTGTVEPLLSGILMLSVGLALLSVMLPLIGMMNGVA